MRRNFFFQISPPKNTFKKLILNLDKHTWSIWKSFMQIWQLQALKAFSWRNTEPNHQQQLPPIICQPHTKTMISKQRCPDAPRSPTSFDVACHPLRLMNTHMSTLVSKRITWRWHAADGGNTPLHLPACCSLTVKKTVLSLGRGGSINNFSPKLSQWRHISYLWTSRCQV